MLTKFSKLLVLFIVVTAILFTIAILYIYVKMGTEPTTLIVAFFGFLGAELGALATIKIKEERLP